MERKRKIIIKIMKTAFAGISYSVKRREFDGILNYLKVRHPKYKFGITDDYYVYVEGEINQEEEEEILFNDLKLIGVDISGVLLSNRILK
jgi:hypothetical protein